MCSFTRSDFSKLGKKTFDVHLAKEHDPWKYIFYIYYLKDKGEDAFNGLEQICWDNFVSKKTDWLPIGKTMYLESHDDQENELEMVNKRLDDMSIDIKMLVNYQLNKTKEDYNTKMTKNIKVVRHNLQEDVVYGESMAEEENISDTEEADF